MVRIGMDIGGTGIQMGVVDDKGHILEKGAVVTRTDLSFPEQIARWRNARSTLSGAAASAWTT